MSDRVRRGLPFGEAGVSPDIGLDSVQSDVVDLGADVVEDRRGDALRRRRCDDHRHEPAERCPDEDRLGNVELVQQLDRVTGVGERIVASGKRVMVADRPAAEIHRQHAETR